MKFFKIPQNKLFIFIFLSFLFYFPTLNLTFLSDDYDFLTRLDSIHNFSSFLKVIFLPEQFFYRPLNELYFFLNYKIFGLNPLYFHFIKIFLLGVLVFIIYRLGTEIFKSNKIGFLASFLFLIYPAHHETVVWLNAPYLLALIFYTLSFYYGIRYLKTFKLNFLILSLFLFLLSLLTHEVAITLPLLLFIFHIFILQNFNQKILKYLRFYLFYLILIGFYFIIRKLAIGTFLGGYSLYGYYPVSLDILKPDKLILIFKNLIFFPYFLIKYTLNYHFLLYNQSNVFLHKLALFLLFNFKFIFLISVLFLVVILIKIHFIDKKRIKFILFLILSLIILLGPSYFLLGGLKQNLEATRFLFFPSLGLAFLLSYLFWELINYKDKLVKLTGILFISFVIFWFGFCFGVNIIPWFRASEIANKSLEQLKKEYPNLKKAQGIYYFLNLPDNFAGAYIWRNGFGKAVALAFNQKNLFIHKQAKRVYQVKVNAKKSKVCEFGGSPSLILEWSNKQEKFIKREDLIQFYKNPEKLEKKYKEELDKFRRQNWILKTQKEEQEIKPSSSIFLRSESASIISPSVKLSPLIFSNIILNYQFNPQSKVLLGKFIWRTAKNEYFIYFPLQADGKEHTFKIDLRKCPVR